MIELRPAKKEEVDIAVPLIYSSGPPSFEYVFKNKQVDAQAFLRYAFVRAGGEFSYQNHHSLYQDGEMVGIGSVFNAKEASGFTVADALNIFRFYGFKSFSTIKHGLKVEKLIKLPERNEIAIAHLGIAPELRGQGLGTKMIDLLKEKANKTAASYWVLDVSEENPKAKALYDRLGFKTTQKHISTLKNQFSYVANHFRMELKE
ncbi:MAG: GNAT family N-acetyltransferase [Saprospiraceae bacterium]